MNAGPAPINRHRPTFTLAVIVFALTTTVASITSSTFSLAQTSDVAPDDMQLGPVFMLSLGGRLYDDLWPILDVSPPNGRNPAFPDLTATDRDTWRCVSCHGWDYDGAGGERAGVAPRANAASLTHLQGADPQAIIERIIQPSHPFVSDALPDLGLFLLAAFISDGQYDRDSLVDQNGKARGDPEAGQAIFEGGCINCHEFDGRTFLRGESSVRHSLGQMARDRPEQALHKILNGAPVTEMLSLRFLPDEAIADLLAYIQTLDEEDR